MFMFNEFIIMIIIVIITLLYYIKCLLYVFIVL